MTREIKRIVAIIAVAILLLSLAACGAQQDSAAGSGDGENTLPSHSPAPGTDAGTGNSAGNSTEPGTTPGTGSNGDGSTTSTDPNPGDSGNPGDNGNPGGGSETSPGTGTDSGGSAGSSGLSGAPDEILSGVIDILTEAGVEMPMSMPPMLVTAEQSQNAIGLSEADFGKYVEAAAQSMAAIGTFAHQIVVIQGIDDGAAVQIKKLVSSSGGYDPQKWICVFPEKAIAVEAGCYVLLVASYSEVAENAVKAFLDMAGGGGEVVTFWDGI